jgi:hypothetical protein
MIRTAIVVYPPPHIMARFLSRSFSSHSSSSSSSHYFLISNSINHLLWCMDHNDPETFASLFTSDGLVEIVKTNTRYNSKDQLKGLCSGIYSKFYPALHFVSVISLSFSIYFFLSLPIFISMIGIEYCDSLGSSIRDSEE